MDKKIHIFKSFEEQEEFHDSLMSNTSINERFWRLYQMQLMSKALRPTLKDSHKRKIIIKHGFTQS